MEKRAGRKLISYIVVFCQILGWSQASFAAGSPDAIAKAAAAAANALGTLDNEAAIKTATEITNQFGNWYHLPKGITWGGKPLEGVFTGVPKPGFRTAAKDAEAAIPLMSKAGETVGQIGIPAPEKVNQVSKLRQMLMKAGKFTFVDFPMEAFTFFVALGALSQSQLITSFGDNPVSWQQHLAAHDFTTAEGRLGYVSFYAFMTGSHACGFLTNKIMGERAKTLPWVSYLGMACGFAASNIYQEASRFPELQQCVASLESRTTQEEEKWAHCERAYDSWSEVGWEKSQQWTPSLFAMMVSTGIAGYAEKVLGSAAKKGSFNLLFRLSKWQIVFDPAMKVLGWVTPGTGQLKIVRFVYKVAQFMAFTKTQTAIEPDIKQFFQNLWDGNDLRTLETDIVYQLYEKKKSGWQYPVPRHYPDLYLSLSKLPQLAMEWRKGSMAEVITRHQNWLQYVSTFSQTYTAAMLFYDHYINEYRNRYISRKPSLLNAPYLLSGIEPVMPEQGPPPNEFYGKTDYEYRQVRRLIEARQEMEKLLKDNEADIEARYPKYLTEVRKFLALLPTADDYKNGRLNYDQYATALDFMNQQLGIVFDPGAPLSKISSTELKAKLEAGQQAMQAIANSKDLSENEKKKQLDQLKKELEETIAEGTNNGQSFTDGRDIYAIFRQKLGNPMPLRKLGVGFLKAYEEGTAEKNNLSGLVYPPTEAQTDRLNNSTINSVYSGVNKVLSFFEFRDEDSKAYTVRSNTLNYLSPSQYLAGQIALGPRADLKQPLVVMNHSGYPAEFSPPRLVDSYNYDFLFNETQKVTSKSAATIFNTPVLVGPTKVKYPNLYTVLIAPTVLPGVLNHKDGFAGWWKDYVEAQYISAWNKFENEYQEIMVDMLEHYKYANPGISMDNFRTWIQTARKNGLSTSPLSGGLQLAFRQERRLYLLTLGEMLKDMARSLPKDSPLLKLGQANPAFHASEHELKFSSVAESIDDHQFVDACAEEQQKKASTDKNERKKLEAMDSQQLSEQLMACVKRKRDNVLNGLDLKTGKGLVEVMATGSTSQWKNNLKPFVPVLEILKSSEMYSFKGILDGYKGQIYHDLQDPYEKNHFAFQDQIERAFYDLEILMDQMKVTEVQSQNFRMSALNGVMDFWTSPKIVVSKISNQQLRDAQTKIEKLVDQLQEQFKQALEKSNPEALPLILADFRGLKTVAQQTAEIGRMINAVSYDRSDEKAQQKGEGVCDKNTMVNNKLGVLGNRIAYTRKACSNMAKAGNDDTKAANPQGQVLEQGAPSEAVADSKGSAGVSGQPQAASNAGASPATQPPAQDQESAPKQPDSLIIQQPEFEKEFLEQNSKSKGDKQPVLYLIKGGSPSK